MSIAGIPRCPSDMARLSWLLTCRAVRMNRYAHGMDPLCAFAVFSAGFKILAALRLNVRARAQRTVHIIQQIVGRGGVDKLLSMLPYVNGYR